MVTKYKTSDDVRDGDNCNKQKMRRRLSSKKILKKENQNDFSITDEGDGRRKTNAMIVEALNQAVSKTNKNTWIRMVWK